MNDIKHTNTDRVKELFLSLMRQEWFFHTIFWLCLYVILVILDKDPNSSFVLKKEFINVAFFGLMVYANLFYLFPTYLKRRNMLVHIIALVVAALMITPVKALTFYLTSTGDTELQNYVLKNQPAIFLSTFFIGVASTIYNIMNEWLLGQRESKELKAQTLQSELKFLKSQINPHFLFNTLNSLYALTLKKSDLAPEIVLKLSEMMRYMLYECNVPKVTLEKEVNYLKNYLELEKIRQGKRMEINLEIQGNIDNQQISPLLFIPFVENSFKHGINNQIAGGFVNIYIMIEGNELDIMIENSKAPTQPSIHGKKSGGIGLVNVQRRLNILYPNKHELNIEQDPNTYRINLGLNLE